MLYAKFQDKRTSGSGVEDNPHNGMPVVISFM